MKITTSQLRQLIKEGLNDGNENAVELVKVDGKPAIAIGTIGLGSFHEIYVFLDIKTPAVHSVHTTYESVSTLTTGELSHMIKLDRVVRKK